MGDEAMTETKNRLGRYNRVIQICYPPPLHTAAALVHAHHTHDVMNCDTKKFNDSQSRRSIQTFPVLEQPNLLIHINYYYYNNRSVALMCLYNRVYTAAIPPLYTYMMRIT